MVVLFRMGSCASRFVALVSVGTGGAVTGDPFVEIVAQVSVVWAGRVLGPGREGASIRKVVTTDRSGIVRPSFPT